MKNKIADISVPLKYKEGCMRMYDEFHRNMDDYNITKRYLCNFRSYALKFYKVADSKRCLSKMVFNNVSISNIVEDNDYNF